MAGTVFVASNFTRPKLYAQRPTETMDDGPLSAAERFCPQLFELWGMSVCTARGRFYQRRHRDEGPFSCADRFCPQLLELGDEWIVRPSAAPKKVDAPPLGKSAKR